MSVKKKLDLPIGDVIQDLREEKSISRMQLGKLIFASYQTVRAIEIGEQYPNLDILFAIAIVLNTTVWQIVKKAEERISPNA